MPLEFIFFQGHSTLLIQYLIYGPTTVFRTVFLFSINFSGSFAGTFPDESRVSHGDGSFDSLFSIELQAVSRGEPSIESFIILFSIICRGFAGSIITFAARIIRQ